MQLHPARAFPVGAAPPHPLPQNCPAQNSRSALDFLPATDRAVPLLSNVPFLSDPLSAIVGKLLQNSSAGWCGNASCCLASWQASIPQIGA